MLELDGKKLIEVLRDIVVDVENLNETMNKTKFNFLSIDSRHIKKGCIFVALKGENFDGFDFIDEAVEKGAKCVVFEKKLIGDLKKKLLRKNVLFVSVKDSIRALSLIAKYNRVQSNARVIAITGSNGKTTTKDFLFNLFTRKFNTVCSEKSFNNHIGVPLTLLKINPETQYAVVEMGMNHKGELYQLSEIALPDIVIVTNIAESHIGYFKSKKEIAIAKAEIFAFAKKNAFIILNSDSDYISLLKRKAGKRKVYLCGCDENADFKVTEIEETKKGYKFAINFLGEKYSFSLSVKGKHNIYNAAFSVAVGFLEGIDYKSIKSGVKRFVLPPMRMDIKRIGKVTIVDDSYNANPYSVKALIDFLSSSKCKNRKIFVLGDMLELGRFSRRFHTEIGRLLYKSAVDSLFCYGEDAKFSAEAFNCMSKNGRKAFFFDCKEKLLSSLSKEIKKGDLVCFKASRAMKLDQVVGKLIEKLEKS